MHEIEKSWKEYSNTLLNFIRSHVSSIEDAEDVMTHVFSKLIVAANANGLPNNISSWLYHVAKNDIIDYYRTRKHFLELPEHISDDVEDESVIQALGQCLLPLINALPENYQLPVMLSEIEEKKHKEIAATLKLSVSATKSRVLRGRKILHKKLLNCCTFQQDNKGNIMDYEKKSVNSCNNC